MSSELKKPRIDKSEDNSSTVMESDNGIPRDPSESCVSEELYKLPIDKQIDFTTKSHLTDTTFIVEGKKIYAGSDFLSIFSPCFSALFKGKSFEERSREEIELNDVKYDDFLKMLEYLADPFREIEAVDVESLLNLGDFYDIKCLVDRAEEFLIDEEELTTSTKFLLADRHRLVRLEPLCHNFIASPRNKEEGDSSPQRRISDKPPRQTEEEIVNSEEFAQLSDSAKASFHSESSHLEDYGGLVAVDEVEEAANGFIAMGSQLIDVGWARGIVLAGLLWNFNDWECYWKKDSPILTVNGGRQSSAEWNVEGFVEVRQAKILSHTGKEVERITNTFKFSLSNTNVGGRMRISAAKDYTRSMFIYITKMSGFRQTPSYDFTVPSEVTDAAFIVEGRKIHVNKQYLSTIYPRFRVMFDDTNEVAVKNVKYEAFIEFLYWIYPSARRNLIASTMFSVLQVANRLKVKMDKSAVCAYLSTCHDEDVRKCAESMIFCFEFNCRSEFYYPAGFQEIYKMIKNSPLYARMTPKKKAKMYKYMLEEMARTEEWGEWEESDEDDEEMYHEAYRDYYEDQFDYEDEYGDEDEEEQENA